MKRFDVVFVLRSCILRGEKCGRRLNENLCAESQWGESCLKLITYWSQRSVVVCSLITSDSWSWKGHSEKSREQKRGESGTTPSPALIFVGYRWKVIKIPPTPILWLTLLGQAYWPMSAAAAATSLHPWYLQRLHHRCWDAGLAKWACHLCTAARALPASAAAWASGRPCLCSYFRHTSLPASSSSCPLLGNQHSAGLSWGPVERRVREDVGCGRREAGGRPTVMGGWSIPASCCCCCCTLFVACWWFAAVTSQPNSRTKHASRTVDVI